MLPPLRDVESRRDMLTERGEEEEEEVLVCVSVFSACPAELWRHQIDAWEDEWGVRIQVHNVSICVYIVSMNMHVLPL
jgi:hypothetical protein